MMDQVFKTKKLKKKRVHDQRRARVQDERSWDDDTGVDESGSFCVSKKTKDTLLQLKSLRLMKKDPYSHDTNNKLHEFYAFVKDETEKLQGGSYAANIESSLNLAEAGLLLHALTNSIYVSQVNDVHDQIVNLVAYVTKTQPPEKKGRGRKKKIEEPQNESIVDGLAIAENGEGVLENNGENEKTTEEGKEIENSDQVAANEGESGETIQTENVTPNNLNESGDLQIEGGPTPISIDNPDALEQANTNSNCEIGSDQIGFIGPLNEEETLAKDQIGFIGPLNEEETLAKDQIGFIGPLNEEETLAKEQIGFIGPLNEEETLAKSNGGENTLQGSTEAENNTDNAEGSLNTQDENHGNENDADEPLAKKVKKERPPPTLISCLDFEPIIIDDENDLRLLKMPELIAHYLENSKNPRATRRTKEELEKLKAEREERKKIIMLEMNGLNDLADLINITIDGVEDNTNIDLLESNGILESNNEPINGSTEEPEELNPFNQIGMLLNDINDFEAINTDSNVTTEDQFEMQKNFTQLQRLLISKEKPIRKKDVDNIFQMIFGRISNICKKYNMDIKRSEEKEEVAVAAAEPDATEIVTKVSQSDDIVENSLKRVNGIHENFTTSILGISQMLPDLIQPTDKITIFERTSEKSMLESKAKCEDMIRRVQHNIVRHFKDWHMIMEHSPEFIHRVHSFESKMKRLLEKEEKKAEFDISKYEKEVLQTTKNVCDDQERFFGSQLEEGGEFSPSQQERGLLESEMDIQVSSPISIEHGLIDNLMDIDGNTSFQASSVSGDQDRPSSTTSSGGLNKWIALSDVFAELNTSNNVEASRSFYAVLALLSFQNLDMNYDPLISVELDLANKLPSTPTLSQASSVSSTSSSSQEFSRGLKIMASRCPKVDTEEVFISPLSNKSRTEEFRAAQQKNGEDHNHNISIADEFTEVKMIQYFGDLFGKRRRKSNNNTNTKKTKLDNSFN